MRTTVPIKSAGGRPASRSLSPYSSPPEEALRHDEAAEILRGLKRDLELLIARYEEITAERRRKAQKP